MSWWPNDTLYVCVTASLMHEFIPSPSQYTESCEQHHTHTHIHTHSHPHLIETKTSHEFITSDELKQNRHQNFWSINEKNHCSSAHELVFYIYIHLCATASVPAYKNNNNNNFRNEKYANWAVHMGPYLRMKMGIFIFGLHKMVMCHKRGTKSITTTTHFDICII